MTVIYHRLHGQHHRQQWQPLQRPSRHQSAITIERVKHDLAPAARQLSQSAADTGTRINN